MRYIIVIACLLQASELVAQPSDLAGNTILTQTVVAYPEHMAGRTTASGEVYNPHGLTVAHSSFTFGTMLELTAPATGQSVMVTVNDRGSMLGSGQIIASLAAMSRLGLTGDAPGMVNVREWKQGPGKPPGPQILPELRRAASATGKKPISSVRAAHQPPPPARAEPAVAPQAAASARFGVQLGSFTDASTARRLAETIDGAWIETATMGPRSVHRVLYGRFEYRGEAEAWHARLKRLGMDGYVRTLN
jgi:peptidoglycan lytic transglycosylase